MKSIQNDISENNKNILAFALTAAMQAAFLGAETVTQLFGYDFQKSEDRALYIKNLVDILFEGAVKVDESENWNVLFHNKPDFCYWICYFYVTWI